MSVTSQCITWARLRFWGPGASGSTIASVQQPWNDLYVSSLLTSTCGSTFVVLRPKCSPSNTLVPLKATGRFLKSGANAGMTSGTIRAAQHSCAAFVDSRERPLTPASLKTCYQISAKLFLDDQLFLPLVKCSAVRKFLAQLHAGLKVVPVLGSAQLLV